MAAATNNTFHLYLFGLVLGAVLSVYLLKRLFPNFLKTLERKFWAWLLNKSMAYIHGKCVRVKAELFKRFRHVQEVGDGTMPHILEVGTGTGKNLCYLPARCSLSCLEPNLECKPYVVSALQQHPGIQLDKFVKGFGEDMKEFADETFDAVVCTFTLCTVRDPEKVVSEIKRVLKPGGSYFFVEHVAAPKSSPMRRWQGYLDIVWPAFNDGCYLTRELWNVIESAGFTSVQLEHTMMETKLAFIKFITYGVAQK